MKLFELPVPERAPPSGSRAVRFFALPFLPLICCGVLMAAEPRKQFDVAADTAERSLKEFAAQSGREVLFSPQAAANIRTNPVKGDFAPSEAIERMLVGTALTATQDPKTRAFTISRSPDPNVTRAAPTVQGDRPEKVADIIELSPFEVTAEQDVGYQGGNTTSGSRLNTSLKDTAAAVSVMTPEFLSDFAANNLTEMIAYAPNVQVDYGDTTTTANSGYVGSADSTNPPFRVRGMAASVAMDYFATMVPIDKYNSERVELAGGPNSVLFGFGAPGGLLNISTKSANLQQRKTEIGAQFGSWKYQRWDLDHNQIVIPGKVAVRVLGLHQNAEGWRNDTFDDARRGTISARLVSWRQTSITVNYEDGSTQRSIAYPFNLVDGYALWRASGSPTLDPNTWTAALQNQGINRPTAVSHIYVAAAGSPGGSYYIPTANANNQRVLVTQPEGPNLSILQQAGNTLLSPEHMAYDYTVYGPHAYKHHDFSRTTARVEQRLGRGTVVELAFNQEHSFIDVQRRNNVFAMLFGDPNTMIPNPAGSGAQVPNPNAGRYYVDGDWEKDQYDYRNHVSRATVSHKLEFGKLLGSHQLAGMFEYGRLDVVRTTLSDTLIDANGAGIGATLNVSRVLRRQYVSFGEPGTYRLAPPDPVAITRGGVTYRNAYVPTGASGDISRRTNTMMLVTHSQFWNKRLVATAGARRDILNQDFYRGGVLAPGDPRIDVARGIVPGSAVHTKEIDRTTHQASRTVTLGGVVHANSWLSFFYNYSNNNGAAGNVARIILTDSDQGYTRPPATSGNTDDYGVMLDLFERRVFLRATGYRTASTNTLAFAANNSTGYNLWALVNQILTAQLAAGYINQADYDLRFYQRVNDLSALGDVVTSGYEASLSVNMTKNLTLQMNGSYSDRIPTNVFREFDAFVEKQSAVWYARPGAGSLPITAGSTLDQHVALMKAYAADIQSGVVSKLGDRPYKAGAALRYRFSDGVLKGVFLGGGMRWGDKAPIGQTITGLNAVGKPMFGHLVYGPQQFNVDGFVGYKFPPPWGAKTGRVNVQLNVSNLTAEPYAQTLRYNQTYTGRAAVLLTEPRSYRLSAEYSF